MVNVLGEAELLEEAEAMIKNITVEEATIIWSFFLFSRKTVMLRWLNRRCFFGKASEEGRMVFHGRRLQSSRVCIFLQEKIPYSHNINVKYSLILVLVDEEDHCYFKQQEMM
ncbi:hypothetical protein DY000_02046218 [Brassica cretica]|uniref:Uncharacterized protein n=1 Tax=Brassica cretica TaxID=69181 RepID=A0ABQ7EUK5_BRACR|nr:hypothetical protein DY000_02046218 [Brassica cretica]